MIRTNPVAFTSAEQRRDVHDAVKGRAEAITENNEEMNALFDVAQTLAHVEMNEPVDGMLLSFPFAFNDESAYKRAIEVFDGQSDDDLDWLGEALDEAGIDEDFDSDANYGQGGVREALRGP